LRGVLDHRNACAPGGIEDWIEIGTQPEEVHGHDGPGARSDRPSHRVRIDGIRQRVDIDQHRSRADSRDGPSRRKERICGRDDLVTGLDVERHQGKEQRVGARRYGDDVLDAQQGAQLGLEGVDLRPHDEALAVGHARHRGQDLLAKRPILGLQVEQRHGHS